MNKSDLIEALAAKENLCRISPIMIIIIKKISCRHFSIGENEC